MEIGRKIIHLDSVDSTNNYTAKLMNQGQIDHGTVILADEQFAGRGQRSSDWLVKPGENLTFTVFLDRVNVSVNQQFILTQIVSLSLVDILKQLDLKAEIKWPNDIYVEGKKIAGVLIENQLRSSLIQSSIIGIGLNVNEVGFQDFIATSIKAEIGAFKNVQEVLYSFIYSFNKTWNEFIKNTDRLNAEYHNNLYLKGVEAHYEDASGRFFGVIKGVQTTGRLIIQKNEELMEYDLKEIKFLMQSAL
jgi:BirA family transcriptional regulator, biotin operon repressor / biotin---[acetyl-CoA-carboxylase] ligase